MDEEKRARGERCELVPDTMYVADRHGPTQFIEVAPATDAHQSKRYENLAAQARELEHKKKFLVEQALEKERIFKLNVQNLRTRIQEFKAKIKGEVDLRQAMHDAAEQKFTTHLGKTVTCLEQDLAASLDLVNTEWLPAPRQNLDAWKDDFEHFVNVTVPETIENQSGRVTRHLIKAQETFEIDNTKLLRRERKINERFNLHVENAATNMREVIRKRKDCFVLAEEDIYGEERRSDRAEETHLQQTHTRIREVQDMQSGLAGIRARTDSEILIAIEETMSRLQTSVLENFGSKAGV